MKKKEQRIGIVGGGLAGLSAGHYLQKMGYKNVTIFEKSPEIGGHCKTETFDNRAYDLGPIYIPDTHKELIRLCNEFGLKLTRSLNFNDRDLLEQEVVRISNELQFIPSKMKFITSMAKFLAHFFQYKLSSAKHGYQCSSYVDVSKPLLTWLKEKDLLQIAPIFYIMMELPLCGHNNSKSALYTLTITKFRNYLTWIQAFLFGQKNSLAIEAGFQELSHRLAATLNVRLSCPIKKVERRGPLVRISTDGQEEEYDWLILGCRLKQALQFLDSSPDEESLFMRERYNRVQITVVRASGIKKRKSSAIYANTLAANGEPSLIIQPWQENDIYIAYSYIDPGVSRDQVIDFIHRAIEGLGGKILEVLKINESDNYLPHVPPEEMVSGYYDRIEAMQGKKKTFFIGSSVTFECTENVVAYSKNLINQYF